MLHFPVCASEEASEPFLVVLRLQDPVHASVRLHFKSNRTAIDHFHFSVPESDLQFIPFRLFGQDLFYLRSSHIADVYAVDKRILQKMRLGIGISEIVTERDQEQQKENPEQRSALSPRLFLLIAVLFGFIDRGRRRLLLRHDRRLFEGALLRYDRRHLKNAGISEIRLLIRSFFRGHFLRMFHCGFLRGHLFRRNFLCRCHLRGLLHRDLRRRFSRVLRLRLRFLLFPKEY